MYAAIRDHCKQAGFTTLYVDERFSPTTDLFEGCVRKPYTIWQPMPDICKNGAYVATVGPSELAYTEVIKTALLTNCGMAAIVFELPTIIPMPSQKRLLQPLWAGATVTIFRDEPTRILQMGPGTTMIGAFDRLDFIAAVAEARHALGRNVGDVSRVVRLEKTIDA